MDCVCCGSAAVTERPERTARGYRRFRRRGCGKQFNERSAGALNRTRYPSDVVALVVPWRLRYRLTLRDLCEMFPCAASCSAARRCGTGKPSSRRSWPASSGGAGTAGRGPQPALACGRDIPEGAGPLVLPLPRDRPGWRPGRHHAERAPRHGRGAGLLPLGQGRHRHDPRPRHHGRARLLSAGDPHHAGPPGFARTSACKNNGLEQDHRGTLLHGSGRWRCRPGRRRRIAPSLIPGCPPCRSS